MTRPTARVLALLEMLQEASTPRTVADLAARLDVDERTVRRYAAHLVDLGIPVRSVRGRYGGYHLAPGYRMPPLMLTDDEAVAVLLGLAATPSTVPAVGSATAKLRRVLPEVLRHRLDALLATMAVTTGTASAPAARETQLLLTLAEAARAGRPTALSYTSADGRHSERTLHPYGVVAHGGRWYVTGRDSTSGEVRTFRLDRIARASVVPGEFTTPAGFDPAEHVVAGLAATPWRHDVAVRLLGTVADVRTRLPAHVATVEEIGDGWVRVSLHAERLDWVAAAIAGLDRPFAVEAPDALRDHLRALADRLARGARRGAGLQPRG